LTSILSIHYSAARVIIDAATLHTKAEGLITDNVTNDPIPDVEVKATKDGITFYTILSLINGTYELLIPIPGIYTILYTKTGYQTNQIHNVVITLGQTSMCN